MGDDREITECLCVVSTSDWALVIYDDDTHTPYVLVEKTPVSRRSGNSQIDYRWAEKGPWVRCPGLFRERRSGRMLTTNLERTNVNIEELQI